MQNSKLVLYTYSEKETEAVGRAVGERLFAGALLLLEGELGAGKTVFARGVARGLGIKGTISSPTFTLLRAYEGRLPFYHFDLYRLEKEDELMELGIDEYLDGDGVALVEWPGRFDSFFTGPALLVYIERNGDEARLLVMSGRGAGYEEIFHELENLFRER